jgi:carboxyl-terminal processing protease
LSPDTRWALVSPVGTAACLGRSPRARRGVVLSLLALIPLIACAGSPGPSRLDATDEAGRLFARAYSQVMEYYLEPLTAQEAALAALKKLTTLDADIMVSEASGAVELRDGGRVVERLKPSPERDWRGWGSLTSTLLHDAKAQSPKLAALSDDEIEQTMFTGLTGSLDRFSRYASPDAAREQRASREGFEGLGITLEYAADEVRVTAVIPGSPADREGIMIDDRLVAVEGVSTGALSRNEVMQRLRGAAGTRVAITLARPGQAVPIGKTVARAYITVPTVSVRRDAAIGIIRISSFNQHTTDSLRSEFTKLRADTRGALLGVILDMRGNPGGLLDQSVAVADSFMNNGRIVSTRGRNPSSFQEFDATTGDITGGLPIVVLMNGGSASAAEIVAAALQDSGRAIVVGTSSFGKGTVQTVLRLPNDGELTLTWARLITPAGYILHEHGVVPNVCTSGTADDEQSIAAILRKTASRDEAGRLARVSLDEQGWSRLRGSCPTRTGDRVADIETAKRLLGDPTLYAHIIHAEPASVAAAAAQPRAPELSAQSSRPATP